MTTVQEHYGQFRESGDKATILLRDHDPILWIEKRNDRFMLVDRDKGLGLRILAPDKTIESIESEWIEKYPAPDNPGQDKT
ncbi:MAG: hypothetical protein GY718_10050 [Lentisphaerae bacterium]|nr:hypothetical protein [Lentisphaerota bacterium]